MKKFFSLVFACAVLISYTSASETLKETRTVALSRNGKKATKSNVKKVEMIELSVPREYNVSYDGIFKENFPQGFETGFGSALAFKSMQKDGTIEFYALTDRGPNGDAPIYNDGAKIYEGKIFPTPKFVPQIAVIRVKNKKAEVVKVLPLKASASKFISGLPLPENQVGSTGEIAWSDEFNKLSYDENGMDPEGLVVDKQGNFWVSDEYGPFITKFSPEGIMLKKYVPGNGLPIILASRPVNRGMEGLSITPDGRKIFGSMQSPLNIEGKTKNACFTRIIELDVASGKVRSFAYPVNDDYKANKDAKIGEIFAVSPTVLLVLEQGADKNGEMQNRIYKVDLKNATDLETYSTAEPVEFAEDITKLSKFAMAKKELLIDLRANGWKAEKAEGLALLPDQRTLVVINDNDFGLSTTTKDDANPKAKITKYEFDKNNKFTYKGQPASPKVILEKNDEVDRHATLMFVTFKNKIGN